jgi:hypothetical protein
MMETDLMEIDRRCFMAGNRRITLARCNFGAARHDALEYT